MGAPDFSSIFSLQNPAMLGLIQGLGQASMPSRLPVSMGGALGMGLQGMQQGQQFGLQQQTGQQNLQTGALELAKGKLGLMQQYQATNYYRKMAGLPEMALPDFLKSTATSAPTGSSAKAFGVSSQGSLTPPDNPDATQPVQPITTPEPTAPAPISTPASQGILGQPVTPAVTQTVESNNNPNAVSSAGARGLMQVMPSTAANPGFGVKPAQNDTPEENQRVGTDYQTALVQHYNGNQLYAAVAYNWGPGNTDHWLAKGGKYADLPQETKDYLGKLAVTSAHGNTAQPPAQPMPVAPSAGPTSAPPPDENPVNPALAWAAQIGQFNPQAAMTLQEKWAEPQNLRGGAGMWTTDPATGKMVQLAYQPQMPEGTHLVNGQLVRYPGASEAAAAEAYAKGAGGKAAELQYDPQIKAGIAAAETAVKNRLTTIEAYDNQTQQKVYVTPQTVLDNAQRYSPSTDPRGNPVAAPEPKTTTGVPIPPPQALSGNARFAAGPSAADAATQAAGEATVKTWFDNLQANVQAEQRFMAMGDALKSIQSGAWTQQKADISRQLLAAGFDANTVNGLLQAPPDQAQIIIKNNFGAALNSMKGITNRVTQNEIFAASKNLANPSLEPAANAAILAQGVGIARYNQALANDWLAAKQAGWTDPLQYQRWWMAQPQNSMQAFVDRAAKDVGPLKGQPGASKSTSAQLPPAARMQLKAGQVTTFKNGQRWTVQNGQPVQVQ